MTLPAFDTIAGSWTIDAAHSAVSFAATHAMVTKVRGRFDDFSGTINVTGENEAQVDVVIQTASVDTRQDYRDNHLRSADFFDAEQFPTMEFHSTGISVKDDEEFTLHGDLTIKGVTKPVSIDVEVGGVHTDQNGALRAGFEGDLAISRKEWGLTWNVALESGGWLVSDKIKINLDISVVKDA